MNSSKMFRFARAENSMPPRFPNPSYAPKVHLKHTHVRLILPSTHITLAHTHSAETNTLLHPYAPLHTLCTHSAHTNTHSPLHTSHHCTHDMHNSQTQSEPDSCRGQTMTVVMIRSVYCRGRREHHAYSQAAMMTVWRGDSPLTGYRTLPAQ